jgi:TatD DNase family protein
MLSDTHFHLSSIVNRGIDAAALLSKMAQNNFLFALDIGTECDDFYKHKELYEKTLSQLSESEQKKIRSIYNFSCGIWPDTNAIADRFNQCKILEQIVTENINNICALGEFGLDRHYNKDNVTEELELFSLQMELAKKLQLPVIIHSREDFASTYSVLKESGYNRGVIHCYSYGIEEAKKFLDAGWYISFSGSITYFKKRDYEITRDLVRYIPCDRLLLETDSPYLAPVPERGTVNTPLKVEYVFNFVSECRNTDIKELSNTVYKNALSLFQKVK